MKFLMKQKRKMKGSKNKFEAYRQLPTEQPNPKTENIDRIPLRKILEKINGEDKLVPRAVGKTLPAVERAARTLSKVFLSGGKVFMVGAGTSGRLAVMEAAELIPTFGVKPGRFSAIMAGGKKAVFTPAEGAEDKGEKGYKAIFSRAKKGDMVIGIAASGITPFVEGALKAGAKKKAKTVLITTNSKKRFKADIVISVDVGPEVISGSTRMKAGTASKLILNMLTTSSMIISGKVYKNWMVDLKPTSRKLIHRGIRITSVLTGIAPEKAAKLLKETKYNVKTAVVMARLGVNLRAAKKLLKQTKGFLKNALRT